MLNVSNPHKKEQARLLVACLAFVAVTIAVIGVTIFLVMRANNTTNQSSTATTTTLSGELACLPKKDSSGPTTLECAIGLRTDDNRYYILKNLPQDYGKYIGNRVSINGTLTTDVDSTYDVAGSIEVTSLQ
jgi:hypothetical protein